MTITRDELRQAVRDGLLDALVDPESGKLLMDSYMRSLFYFQQQRATGYYADTGITTTTLLPATAARAAVITAQQGSAWIVERIGWRETVPGGTMLVSVRINDGAVGGYDNIGTDLSATSMDWNNLTPVDLFLPPGSNFHIWIQNTAALGNITVEARARARRIPLALGV